MPRVFMPRKVISIGNSLAITIPSALIKSLSIRKGDEIAFIVEEGMPTSIEMCYHQGSEESIVK